MVDAKENPEKHEGTGAGVRICAALCFAAALAGQGALGLFVLLLGLDLMPERVWVPPPWPWLFNVSWLALFAAQHSGMARAGFKRTWTRVLPPALERSV